MRYVKFDPENLTGDDKDFWTKWLERSEKARKNAVDQVAKSEKVKFNDNVWKDLKTWLLKHVFHNKCAYCEGKYVAGTYNDAEHWRPKNLVTVDGAEVSAPGDPPNRGYWWLAYDWRNLVPACNRCNGSDGKMNEFPVANAHALGVEADVADLDLSEAPLLLHPYDTEEKPEEHLKFGLQGVVAEDKSSTRGKASIKTLNLARGELNEDRAEEQQKAEDGWLKAVSKLAEDQVPISETMKKWVGPGARFSQSVKAYVEYKKDDFLKALRDSI